MKLGATNDAAVRPSTARILVVDDQKNMRATTAPRSLPTVSVRIRGSTCWAAKRSLVSFSATSLFAAIDGEVVKMLAAWTRSSSSAWSVSAPPPSLNGTNSFGTHP